MKNKTVIFGLLGGIILLAVIVLFLVLSNNKQESPPILQSNAVGKPLSKNPKISPSADTVLRFKVFLAGSKPIASNGIIPAPTNEAAVKSQKIDMLLVCKDGKSIYGTQGLNFDIAKASNAACQKVLKLAINKKPLCSSRRPEDNKAGWGTIKGTIKNEPVDLFYSQEACGLSKRPLTPDPRIKQKNIKPENGAWQEFTDLWQLKTKINKKDILAGKQETQARKRRDQKLTLNHEEQRKQYLANIKKLDEQNKKFLAPNNKTISPSP
jgi:hypothetical protein